MESKVCCSINKDQSLLAFRLILQESTILTNDPFRKFPLRQFSRLHFPSQVVPVYSWPSDGCVHPKKEKWDLAAFIVAVIVYLVLYLAGDLWRAVSAQDQKYRLYIPGFITNHEPGLHNFSVLSITSPTNITPTAMGQLKAVGSIALIYVTFPRLLYQNCRAQ